MENEHSAGETLDKKTSSTFDEIGELATSTLRAAKTLKKGIKKDLNFNKSLGLPHWAVFHIWNCFMIADGISKYVWY